MSSIFGEVNYNGDAFRGVDTQKIISSMKKRSHAHEGAVFYEHAALLHTWAGNTEFKDDGQPLSFCANGQEYCIVYNGKIYNRAELQKELEACGFVFEESSDAEVLLKSYIRWGEECVNKFNGNFAFAIWEAGTQKLFFARDHMGVKPFFYSLSEGKFIFGSEINTILKHPAVKPEIDINSVAEIMLLGPGRAPDSGVFTHINELPPAHCGRFSAQGPDLRRYWRVTDSKHTDSLEQSAARVRELVCDSIERQFVSHVPGGVLLSGGLDSSIVSAVAAAKSLSRGKELKTFSIFYRDNEKYFKKSRFQPSSDSDYIDIICKHLGCENIRIVIDTPELVSALYDAVDARDLPGMGDIDSSLLLACKEVKKHCSVVLSGECADEIFGGYPWYRDKSIRESEGFPWAQSTMWRYGFIRKDLREKIDPGKYVYEKYKRTALDTDISQTESEQEKKIKIMVNLNMQWFMQTLIERNNTMSMYSGIEIRAPFCDYGIVQYLYTTPWEFKDYNNYEKGLLREAFKDLLPSDVLWRKKSPFPKTHNPAYLDAVSAQLRDILSNPNEPIFDIADKDMLETLPLSQNQNPWYGQLMTVPQTIAYFLQLNYWLKKYNVTIIG